MVHRLRQRRGALAAAGTLAAAATLVACGVLAGVGAAGAAEQAAEVRIGVTTANTWAPNDPTVVPVNTGDEVVWDFTGSVQPHNVKGASGPAEDPEWLAVKTGFQTSGEFRRTFGTPGTYKFICEVHPGTMTGTLEVTGEPVETPVPTPSPTATPTPTATPGPSGTTPVPDDHTTTPAPGGSGAAADRAAPTLSRIGLTGRRGHVRVRFSLSEPATVTLWLKARGSGKVLRTVRLQARAGVRTVTVRSSRVKRGQYIVQLEARDALGNRSGMKRSVLRVRGR